VAQCISMLIWIIFHDSFIQLPTDRKVGCVFVNGRHLNPTLCGIRTKWPLGKRTPLYFHSCKVLSFGLPRISFVRSILDAYDFIKSKTIKLFHFRATVLEQYNWCSKKRFAQLESTMTFYTLTVKCTLNAEFQLCKNLSSSDCQLSKDKNHDIKLNELLNTVRPNCIFHFNYDGH